MLPPTAKKLPDIIYDAPRIKWYANVADHPSIFRNEEKGFVGPQPPAPEEAPAPEAQVRKPLGPMTVEVAKIMGLAAKTLPDHGKYRVSAYYPAEESFVIDGRKSQAFGATKSSARGNLEDCEMDTKLKLPFNKMEQFLRIAVFRVSLPNDTLVGEVSIPLADPDAESMGEYYITDANFEDQGAIFLKLRLPQEDDEDQPQEPPFGTQCSIGSSLNEPPCGTQAASSSFQGSPTGAPPPPFSGVTEPGESDPAQIDNPANTGLISGASENEAKPEETSEFTPDGKYHVGQSWEYFSATANAWVPARVGRILGWTIVLEYALRERPLDVRDAEAVKSLLREPEMESRVDGDSFFLSLRQQAEMGLPMAEEAETGEATMQGQVSAPVEEKGPKADGVAQEESDDEGSGSSSSSSSSSGGTSTSSPTKAAAPVVVQGGGSVPVVGVSAAMGGLPSGGYMQATSSNGQAGAPIRYVAQGGGYVIAQPQYQQPQQVSRGPSGSLITTSAFTTSAASAGLPSQPYLYSYGGATASAGGAAVHLAPGSYAVQPPGQPQSQVPYIQQPQSQLKQPPQSVAAPSSPYILQAGLPAAAATASSSSNPYSQYNGAYTYNYAPAAGTTPGGAAMTVTTSASAAAQSTAGTAQTTKIQASASPYPAAATAGAAATPYYYSASTTPSVSAMSAAPIHAAPISYATATSSTPQVIAGQYHQAGHAAGAQPQVTYAAPSSTAAAAAAAPVATPYVIPSGFPAPGGSA